MHCKFVLVSLSFLFSSFVSAKLLDKIIAVVDDKVFTLSQMQRIMETFTARSSISPQLYSSDKNSLKSIIDLQVNGILIRSKLSELGYIVSDDQVEDQIKNTEKRLGLNRAALLQFLRSNNLSFEEYFEIIRATYEYNIFLSRVITPLISITDYEIKNEFLKHNSSAKTITYQYDLVDFSVAEKSINNEQLPKLSQYFKKYRESGSLPDFLKNSDTNKLDGVSEDAVFPALKKQLKSRHEGDYTDPIKIGLDIHVFYIKKREVIESEAYTKLKPRIKNHLYNKEISKVRELWYKRQSNNHYIKVFN